MIYGVTGHRPDKLGGYSTKASQKLTEFAQYHLYELQPDEVITGMALGWDMSIASACVNLNIPFIAAIPFEGQEKKWPDFQQELYHQLLRKSREVVNVSKSNMFSFSYYQIRNMYIVDNCDTLLALWNGSIGGTYNCIEYANKVNMPIINLWKYWNKDYAKKD
jgi:uncharacterized phage-like protein YoqJ